MNDNCPIFVFKDNTVKRIVDLAIKKLRNNPQRGCREIEIKNSP
jgi:hypothetical protein